MEPMFFNFKDDEDYEVFLNISTITGFTIRQMPNNPYKYFLSWNSLGGHADNTTVNKRTMERIRGIMLEHSLA